MIQPIKQFRVTRLTISGFKGYADQKTFQFGGMNVISGHMGHHRRRLLCRRED